jgi:hypothetical protein
MSVVFFLYFTQQLVTTNDVMIKKTYNESKKILYPSGECTSTVQMQQNVVTNFRVVQGNKQSTYYFVLTTIFLTDKDRILTSLFF